MLFPFFKLSKWYQIAQRITISFLYSAWSWIYSDFTESGSEELWASGICKTSFFDNLNFSPSLANLSFGTCISILYFFFNSVGWRSNSSCFCLNFFSISFMFFRASISSSWLYSRSYTWRFILLITQIFICLIHYIPIFFIYLLHFINHMILSIYVLDCLYNTDNSLNNVITCCYSLSSFEILLICASMINRHLGIIHLVRTQNFGKISVSTKWMIS